jgi:hypothetical protein
MLSETIIGLVACMDLTSKVLRHTQSDAAMIRVDVDMPTAAASQDKARTWTAQGEGCRVRRLGDFTTGRMSALLSLRLSLVVLV